VKRGAGELVVTNLSDGRLSAEREKEGEERREKKRKEEGKRERKKKRKEEMCCKSQKGKKNKKTEGRKVEIPGNPRWEPTTRGRV
jgi:hypothetical protein